MNSYVELFDLRSGNVAANYADENETWDALCNWARDDGLASIEEFALARIENGDIILIAMDDDLVQRVVLELEREPVASESRR